MYNFVKLRRKIMFISIKNRLIFLLIVFTLLPFVLLRIVAYPRMQSDLQDVLIRNLDGLGHKQSELVTTWIHERMKNTRVIANNPLMAKCARLQEKTRTMQISSNILK